MLLWIGLFILITAVAVYFRVSLITWSLLVAAGLVAVQFCPEISTATKSLLWVIYAAVVIPLEGCSQLVLPSGC